MLVLECPSRDLTGGNGENAGVPAEELFAACANRVVLSSLTGLLSAVDAGSQR